MLYLGSCQSQTAQAALKWQQADTRDPVPSPRAWPPWRHGPPCEAHSNFSPRVTSVCGEWSPTHARGSTPYRRERREVSPWTLRCHSWQEVELRLKTRPASLWAEQSYKQNRDPERVCPVPGIASCTNREGVCLTLSTGATCSRALTDAHLCVACLPPPSLAVRCWKLVCLPRL